MGLMIALLIKHFFADFPMQTPYMLKGKSSLTGWFLPLLSHAAVHAILTAAVLAVAGVPATLIAVLATAELALHVAIDRLKAHPKLGGRWNPAQPQFWWALGADQLAHGLCYCAIVVVSA